MNESQRITPGMFLAMETRTDMHWLQLLLSIRELSVQRRKESWNKLIATAVCCFLFGWGQKSMSTGAYLCNSNEMACRIWNCAKLDSTL